MIAIASRLTPRNLYLGYSAMLLLLLAAGYFPSREQPDLGFRSWVLAVRAILGYSAAILLCISVGVEHRRGSWFRVAWFAFAGNAAASIIRHAADTPLWDRLWEGYSAGPEIALLRQSAIVVGLGSLLAGVLALIWAFRRVGILLSPRRSDFVSVAGVFGVLATIFYLREGLAEARSVSVAARYLQQIGLVLLAASAACSIPVYRVAREMRGGRMGVTMLFIVVYTVLRCVLVCVSLFPALQAATLAATIPLDLAVPWLFALAAAYRYGLASHGAAQIPLSSPVSSYVKQTFPGTTRIS